MPDTSFWVKDEFVLKCESCSTPFSVTIRRHHCRACGQVFCADCTTKQMVLPELGYGNKIQKVCEACFTKHTANAASGSGRNKSATNAAGTGGDAAATEAQNKIAEGLKRLYTAGIKPLEVQFRFDDFYSPILVDADFVAKPMVLLMGQYSVGKTSFIRHLLGRDFPGIRIGPEPTTDRFMIVARSEVGQDSSIPGNALAVRADRPFQSLQKFGASFLNKLECSEVNVEGSSGEILNDITFVDTPGVLSGEKQRIGRSYDFPGVVEWFAGRCDRILLLFDAHKLDISDEFQKAIYSLRGHDEKIRVVLNKADSVDAQQLMKVHGALMWSLGKVINTPEVVRVYVGSFWDNPVQNKEFESLFYREREDLLNDLRSLPGSAVVRKVNEVVKRARSARIHALLIDHLRKKLPYFRKESAMNHMLENIEEEYKLVSQKNKVPLGDFPKPEEFRRALQATCNNDLSNFPVLNMRMISECDDILQSYIPRLLAQHTEVLKGVQKTLLGTDNPFNANKDRAIDKASAGSSDWLVSAEDFATSVASFKAVAGLAGHDVNTMDINEVQLKGSELREVLLDTGLSPTTLKHLWDLADVDEDGALDVAEFALAQYLIQMAKSGKELPSTLPSLLIPPSKR